jgi:hypothetical protein
MRERTRSVVVTSHGLESESWADMTIDFAEKPSLQKKLGKKKMINQAPIVRHRAAVSEIFFADFRKQSFSAEPFAYFTSSNYTLLLTQPHLSAFRCGSGRSQTAPADSGFCRQFGKW